MSKRIGVIGIVIQNPDQISEKVNATLSDYRYMISGRMGIPKQDKRVGVIALIVEGNTDDLGALTGKLGNLPGVLVKSALTAAHTTDNEDL